MFCHNCGSQVDNDAKFCSVCGAVLPGADTLKQQPSIKPFEDNTPFGAAYENTPPHNNQPDNSPFGSAYETPQSMQRYNNPPYYNNNGNQYNGNGYNGNQYYGNGYNGNQYPPQQQSANNNVHALVGFILSFFVPIAGLILSIIGLKNSKMLGGKRKGFAIAGIIISAVQMFINLVLLIILGPEYYLAMIFGSFYDLY